MAKASKKVKSDEPFVENVTDVDLAQTMFQKYRDYATHVVTDRALADVRDGMKPVHRRIIYVMATGGYDWSKGYSKSARIVGDVMGKFHPHGDSSIYEAMARMAQPWSLSEVVVDGQGNFGSPDGDSPAAMRYTEARLAKLSEHLVSGLSENATDFRPNYDGKDREPTVLPAAFPNVLVSGGTGIAVGMAASVPPHNLSEVCRAAAFRVLNPGCSVAEILSIMPAPDFPTGGKITGDANVTRAYATGRGSATIEASTFFEKDGKNPVIVYTDVPYGVSRNSVLSRIKDMITSGSLPGVVSVRDETDRNGGRFVVELKPGEDHEKTDRILKSGTDLRTTVSMNFRLIDGRGRPREMSVTEILDDWIEFRRITLKRTLNHELLKLRDQGRLLLGRLAVISVMDKVIKLIRESADNQEACERIMALTFRKSEFEEIMSALGTREQRRAARFSLSRTQADDILGMRLGRLTGLERDDLKNKANAVVKRMGEIRDILRSPGMIDDLIIQKLNAIAQAHGRDRRTLIEAPAAPAKKREVMAITAEKCVVYVNDANEMLRSSKPSEAEDARSFVVDTASKILFFTSRGDAYGVDVRDVPSADDKAPFRSYSGITGVKMSGDVISVMVLTHEQISGSVLCFVSKDGAVRRTKASEFDNVPSAGKMAMKLSDEDPDLLSVFEEAPENGALFMGAKSGKVIRFPLGDVRVMAGRGSRGVTGMKLADGDVVVSAFGVPALSLSVEETAAAELAWLGKKKATAEDAARIGAGYVVQASEGGYRKTTPLSSYRMSGRAIQGTSDKGSLKAIGDISGWGFAKTLEDSALVAGVLIPASGPKRAGRGGNGDKLA